MANANASSPGRSVATATSGMEINIPKGEKVGINEAGETVLRTTMTNGNIRENRVFPADYPDAKPFPKAKAKTEPTEGDK